MYRELSEQIKAALESGNLEGAMPLIAEYGCLAKSALAGARTAGERSAILSETSSFLEDRLHFARVLRSHVAAQLAKASCLCSYSSAAQSLATWDLRG